MLNKTLVKCVSNVPEDWERGSLEGFQCWQILGVDEIRYDQVPDGDEDGQCQWEHHLQVGPGSHANEDDDQQLNQF